MDSRIGQTSAVRSIAAPQAVGAPVAPAPAARPAAAPSDRVTLGAPALDPTAAPRQVPPPFGVKALGACLAGVLGGIPATVTLDSVTLAANAPQAPPDPHRALADALGGYERRVTAHEERLARLPVPNDIRPAVTLAWAGILGRLQGYGSDSMLTVLDEVAKAADVPTAIAGVRTLVEATPDAALTARDAALVLQSAAAHPAVPPKEIFDTAAALRTIDPQRSSYDPRYGPIDAALDIVVREATPQARAAALQQLQALHAGGRDAQQAARWHTAIEALPAPAEARAVVTALLPNLERRSGESVLAMLEGLQGRPAAMAELRAFQTLAGVVQPVIAAADLAAAQKVGDAHPDVPLDERIAHLVTLRKTDPKAGSPPDLGSVLAHVCAAPDASARRQLCDAVIGLQGSRHDAAAALDVQRRLEALKCTPADAAEVRAEYLKRRQPPDRWTDQRAMSAAIDVVAPRADARDAYLAFGALTAFLEAPQALADLKAMTALADSSGVPVRELGEHAEALRKLNIPEDNRDVRDLAPTLAYVAAAPTAAERLERRNALLSLHVGRRTCDQAREVDSRLRTLQASPAERDALRTRLVETMGRARYWHDAEVLSMLDALQARPHPVEAYGAWEALLQHVDFGQAASDLRSVQAARDRFPAVPFAEVQARAVALRAADRKQSQSESLAPVLDRVLEPPDASEREARQQRVIELSTHGRGTARGADLERRLAALGGTDDDRAAARAQVVALLDATYRDADKSLAPALDALAGRDDARHALAAFARVASATGDSSLALADTRALLAVADPRHVPVASLGASLAALREADPNVRRDYQRKFSRLDEVLAHIADAPDEAARATRQAEVLGLQRSWRDAAAVLPFQKALLDLGGSPQAQGRMRTTLTALLDKHRQNDDPTLLDVLASLKGRADAADELDAFATLGTKAYAAEALRDLRGLQALRDERPDVPLSTMLEHALAARAAERSGGQGDAAAAVRHILGAADAAHARETLAPLTSRYGLDGGLAIEERILSLPCSPGDQQVVRDAMAGFKGLEVREALTLLDLVKAQPQAPVVVKTFGALRELGVDAALGTDDLKQALALAGGASLEEMCGAVVTLRKSDPSLQDYYNRNTAGLGPALQAIAGGSTPAVRSATTTRLAAAMRGHRTAELAVALDTDLLGACPELSRAKVAEAFAPAMSVTTRGRDAQLRAVAAAASGRPRIEEELGGAMGAQAGASYVDHEVLLADLRAMQAAVDAAPTVDLAEAAVYLKALRAASERRVADVGQALEVVLAGADPAERRQRAEAASRLVSLEGDGAAASEDLRWILDDPASKADAASTSEEIPSFAARVDRFVDLRRYAKPEERAAVREVYDRILSDALVEKQGWVSRLFRRPRRMLNLVYSLIKLGGTTGRAARYTRAVEQGRFEGETLRASFKRFKKLFHDSEGDTAEGLAAFFERLRAPVAWQPADDERWKTAKDLVKKTGSTRPAGAIWKAMVGSPTREEAQARRQAWFELRGLSDRDYKDFTTEAYEAVVDTCGSSPSAAPFAEMRKLVEKQGAGLAARTWNRSLELCAADPAELTRVRSVLSSVRDERQQDQLGERLATVVAGEPLSFRALLLDEVMTGRYGLHAYDATTEALKGEADLFQTIGRAYASLVTMLGRTAGGGAASVARGTLDWIKKEHEAAPDGMTVSEMFMELSASLVLKPDLDAAKAGLRAKQAMLRKARQGTQTVSAGTGEVNLGGIRVKVRKDEPA